MKICWLVAVCAAGLLGFPATGWAKELRSSMTFISSDSRKMVLYADKRLVFFDGLGQNAQSVADVNCIGRAVIASKTRKYLATCSQFIGVSAPVRIFNNQGEKTGEFPLQQPWTVRAISDHGDLIALGQQFGGESPIVVRLCDLNGNIIVEYDTHPTRIQFTSDGTPVVWGAKAENRNAFVSILDNKGQTIATYEYQNQEIWIHEIMASTQASTLVLVEGPRKELFADRLTVWNPKSGSLKTIAIPDDFGVINQGPAISPAGSYAILRLGAKAIALVDTVNGSFQLTKNIDDILAGGYHFTQIFQTTVTDNGKILVLGYCSGISEGAVGYCVLDKTGNVLTSKILADFRGDKYSYGRVNIQELMSDRFGIVSPRNKVEIIELR